MREAAFVKHNRPRWLEFEQLLTSGAAIAPDKLAEIFIQLTDDLAFARTQYPESRTTRYLNDLTSRIHLEIYKNKRESTGRIWRFWKYEVPQEIYAARKQLLYALAIFLFAGLIGMVSALYDDSFSRLVLGDAYVNLTKENIRNGNPTGIYGDDNAVDMFFSITINNIMVSFWVFVISIFTSLATGYLLFSNGVMVGTFLTMFYNEGVFGQAAPVVMLHGTIELSSIVLAGAAGLVMGNGILFPGTYSRLESFRRSALTGLKIILGLVPFFVIAGFIESFVTRYAFMPAAVKMAIIGASALAIIGYFVIYPYRVHHAKNTRH